MNFPSLTFLRGTPQIAASTAKGLQQLSSSAMHIQLPAHSTATSSRQSQIQMNSPSPSEKANQAFLKHLPKFLVYLRQECFKNDKAVEVCIEKGLLSAMIKGLPYVQFEEQKELDRLIHRCLRLQKAFDTLVRDPDDLCGILLGYFPRDDLVGIASPILKKLLQQEPLLCKFLAKWENIQTLLAYMQEGDFDLLANSSSTLSMMMCTPSPHVDAFFQQHFEEFFDSVMRAIVYSEHKLIRTWYLSIVYQILTMRRHVAVLLRFIENDQYLRVILNRLLSVSLAEQTEGIKVFSLFVLSPHKTEAVLSILKRNKERLIEHFSKRPHPNDAINDLRLRILRTVEEL